MRMQSIILTLLCTITVFYCGAQPIRDRDTLIPPHIKTAVIHFQANHDFYLTVGNNKYNKISKAKLKEVKLPVGIYKLLFEEADSTGQVIERYMRVTTEMTKIRDSIYTVSFNNDFGEILKSYGTEPVTISANTPTPNDQEIQIKAVAKELSDSMILKQGGRFTTVVNGSRGTAVPQTVRSLYVGKYEVTQRQWQIVMGMSNKSQKNCFDCPVENVSWNEAIDFIDKLNKTSNKKFRLPTEVEWEYITDKSFVEAGIVSSDPERLSQLRKSIIEESAWYAEKKPQPVGKKTAISNVFDLFGNVAEWCADDNTITAVPGQKKVFKGGSYKDKEDALRIPARGTAAPNERLSTVGFRLVTNAD